MTLIEYQSLKRGDVVRHVETRRLRAILDAREKGVAFRKLRPSRYDPCSWTSYTRSELCLQYEKTSYKLRLPRRLLRCPRHGFDHIKRLRGR